MSQKKIAAYEDSDWKKQTKELPNDSAAVDDEYSKYTVKQLKGELRDRGTMSPMFIEYPHSHMKYVMPNCRSAGLWVKGGTGGPSAPSGCPLPGGK